MALTLARDWNRVPTDIILKTEEQEIKVHKLMLIVSVPYFYDMFNSNFVEQNSNIINVNLPAKQLISIIDLV